MNLPARFGKYLLLQQLPAGHLAEVFVAKDAGPAGLQRIVALKRLQPHAAADDEVRTAFLDEARISLSLNHANIVHVLEVAQQDDAYYLAMEYVSGKSLEALLEHHAGLGRPMQISQAVFIASRICEGLEHAHQKKDGRGAALNIVHRGVAPVNVLITYDGEIKLIDFGLAKAANRLQRTQVGELKGQAGYMSPEQVRGEPVDRRADLFAVGLLLYRMLTGRPAFEAASDYELMAKVANGEVTPPQELNPYLPERLSAAIMKALASQPADRFQWASELQHELVRFLLAEDQPFTAKQLADWMRNSFAEDLRQEEARVRGWSEGPARPTALRPGTAGTGPRPAITAVPSGVKAAPPRLGAPAAPSRTHARPPAPPSPPPMEFSPPSIAPVRIAARPPPPAPAPLLPEPDEDSTNPARQGIVLDPDYDEESPREERTQIVSLGQVQGGPAAPGMAAPRPVPAAAPRPPLPVLASADALVSGQINPTGAMPWGDDVPLDDEDEPQTSPHLTPPPPRPPPASGSTRRPLLAAAALLGLAVLVGAGVVVWSRTSAVIQAEGAVVLVRVSPSVPDTQITISGRLIQPDVVSIYPAGEYDLRVTAPGFLQHNQQIVIFENEKQAVLSVFLEPERAPEPEPEPVVEEVAPPTFTALFEAPEGAEILLDGAPLGTAPGVRAEGLIVGRTYRYLARKRGFVDASGELTAAEAGEVPVSIQLVAVARPVATVTRKQRPPPPVQTGAQGFLVLTSDPEGASVWVDGKPTARRTPITADNPLKLKVGRRKVLLELGGMTSEVQVVMVEEGGTVQLQDVVIDQVKDL